MASNQTANYGLNQWEAEDKVLRTDFNADNAKLDAALVELAASQLQVATGTYTGTGVYGASNPNTLTFPFKPLLVLVRDIDNSIYGGSPWIRGTTCGWGYLYSSSSGSVQLEWSDNGVSWYLTSNAADQLNANGTTYCYLAFGFTE